MPRTVPKENGQHRTDKGRFAKGNPGRPPGIPNSKAVEIKEFCREVLLADNPKAYLQNVRVRIFTGQADHMEKFFAEHLWGKPRENISVSLTEVHLLAVAQMSDLELSAFLEALVSRQPEVALKLLPGSAA